MTMPDIKTRDVVAGTIKTVDRSAMAGQRMKDSCRECTRTVGNYQIMGYGIPTY